MLTKFNVGDIVRIPFKVKKIEIKDRYDKITTEYFLEPCDETQSDMRLYYCLEDELVELTKKE